MTIQRSRLVLAGIGVGILAMMPGCAIQGQSRYSHQEVGRASQVAFGVIAGAHAMSNIGSGNGNVAADQMVAPGGAVMMQASGPCQRVFVGQSSAREHHPSQGSADRRLAISPTYADA